MRIWANPKKTDRHISFEWYVGDESGTWTAIARIESGILSKLWMLWRRHSAPSIPEKGVKGHPRFGTRSGRHAAHK
jgi:hypothetical protein